MKEAGFNSDVVESPLAHADKIEARKTYNRSKFLNA
jgi:hypothetical protein